MAAPFIFGAGWFAADKKFMPLTKLDPVAALVVIDLQKGIVALPMVDHAAVIIGRTAQLTRAFRERELPVLLLIVTGGAPGRTDAGPPKVARPADWAELVPELDQQSSDHLVTKKTWGAFLGTNLDSYLRQYKVTQIVLAGIATSIGVESTARSAYDLGYNVVLVIDAMTDRNAEAHRNSIDRIFPRLGETAKTEDVLKMLRSRATD